MGAAPTGAEQDPCLQLGAEPHCWARSRLSLGQHEAALIAFCFALELVEDLPLLPVVLCTNDGHLEELAVELHGGGAVIVPRDGVGDEAGVTVCVHHPHRGDVHLGGIPDGHVGLEDVVEAAEEDEEVGQADAGPELDGGVGEQAALPVACVRVLPALPRRALDQVAELAVAADEEDDALAVGDVGGEVEGQLEMIHRLVQVDDVLIQAAAEDVGLHEPMPTSLFVPQVHPGVEEIFQGEELLHVEEVGLAERLGSRTPCTGPAARPTGAEPPRCTRCRPPCMSPHTRFRTLWRSAACTEITGSTPTWRRATSPAQTTSSPPMTPSTSIPATTPAGRRTVRAVAAAATIPSHFSLVLAA